MLERPFISDPALIINPFRMATPIDPAYPLTPVQELEKRDRASFESNRRFMPLSTVEGLTVAVQDIRESLLEIKEAITKIRAEDIAALHDENDKLRSFQNKLVGAGLAFSILLAAIITVASYNVGRWENAYNMSQRITDQMPGIIATEKTDVDEIWKIDKKLEDIDKAKLDIRMNDVEQKLLDLEHATKPAKQR